MKNLNYFILCIMILAHSYSSGQCVRGIRTNPLDPFNNEFEQAYPNLNNPFINRFDWAKFNNVTLEDIQLNPSAGWTISTHSMFSPYSMNMPPEYDYLYTVDNHIVPINQLDWHWEDGWELMYLNTGYYPDGSPIDNPDPQRVINTPTTVANSNVPYFILYNKYTAKLRVFGGLYTPFGAAQDIYMTLGYEQKPGDPVSSIFRSLGNYDRPMDINTIHQGVTTFNKNANNDHTWFSSDIQLSYDPCVCQNTTSFTFKFDVTSKLAVNLYGREISVQENLDVAQKDFLNQSAIRQGSENGNNLLYKRMDKLYADYQKQLEDYEVKKKDYNSLQNQIKRKVIGIAKDAFTSGVAGAIPTSDIKKFLLKNNFKLFGKEFPDTNTAEGWSKLAKEGAKGLAGQGFDYLSQTIFGKDNAPIKPTMPSATFSEMRISGSIDENNPIKVTNLYTPGSYSPNSGLPLTTFNYPIYNEAVGLFALLEKPGIDFFNYQYYEDVRTRKSDYIKSYIVWDQGGYPKTMYDTTQRDGVKNYISHTSTYLKLNQPLKFKFNHAADFNWDKTKVYVSFEIEYAIDYQWIKTNPVLDSFDSLAYFQNNGNMELLHMYEEGSLHRRSYNTKWVPVEDAGQQVFGIEFTDSLLQKRNQSWPNFVYSESQVKALWPPRITRIKMKLMSDMYFNQLSFDGAEINTTQVFTYLIYDQSNPQNQTSSINQITNKNDIAKYTLGEVILDGQIISQYSNLVTDVQNNDLYIDAESVKVKGNVWVWPGYNLHVRSLNDITISTDSIDIDFSPETTFETKRDFFSVGHALEVSDAELADFCAGNNKKYEAGVLAKGDGVILSPGETKDQPDPYSLNIYPNPASDILNINITNGMDGIYDLTLIDLLGKEVFRSSKQIPGTTQTYINIADYPNGVYFVKVSNNQTSVCKRILISH